MIRISPSFKRQWLYVTTLVILSTVGFLGSIRLIPEVYSAISSWSFGQSSIDHDIYQAVFLTNNQIYFGHLDTHSKFMVLRDVYYIQVDDGNAKGRLVKLGEA